MGTNQHQRGTWINEQLYAIHLLMGKQAKPGQQHVLAHRSALGLRYLP